MKIKGYVNITLHNIETDEVEYESETWENIVNNAMFFRAKFHTYDIGNSTVVTNRFSDYTIVVGDQYVPNTDKKSYTYPGRWYPTTTLVGATPYSVDYTIDSFTTTIVKRLDPPFFSTTRNIHSVGMRDTRGTGNNIQLHSIASNSTPVVQSDTQYAVIQYSLVGTLSRDHDWAFEFITAYQFFSAIDATDSLGNGTTSLLTSFPWTAQGKTGSALGDSMPAYNLSTNSSNTPFYPKRRTPLPAWTGTDISNKPNMDSWYTKARSSNFAAPNSFSQFEAWDGLVFNSVSYSTGFSSEGGIASCFSNGNSDKTIQYIKFLPEGANKTQQYYGKLTSPTVPFFLASEIPSTAGTINLDTSVYDPKYHEFWKIDFGGVTGGIGTAEYSFMKRYVIGFTNNTFVSRIEPHNIDGADGFGSWLYDEFDFKGTTLSFRAPLSRLDEVQGLPSNGNRINERRDQTNASYRLQAIEQNIPVRMYPLEDTYTYNVTQKEIVLVSWINAETIRINSINNPTFTPGFISGYEYDEISDTFWLSCSTTGIWSVSNPMGSPTITNHNVAGLADVTTTTENKGHTIALGINQGSFRTVWAVIEGALIKSTDNGSSWTAFDSTSTGGVTFTQSSIEAAWETVLGLKADKNTDNRLLMFYVLDPTASVPTNFTDGHISSSSDVFPQATAGTWWSSANDCTNLSTTNGSFSFYTTGSTPFYFTFSTRTSTYNTESAAMVSTIKRQFRFIFGCGKSQSTWWVDAYAEDNPTSAAGYVPRKLFFERQVGGSPDIFGQFSNPTTMYISNPNVSNISGNYGVEAVSTMGWVGGSSNADRYGTNQKRVPYETVDDDGNDVLLLGTSYTTNLQGKATTDAFFMLRFSDLLISEIDSTPNLANYWYIGRGLLLDRSNLVHLGTGYYGFDPALNLIGEIYERYVWTGSIWRRRTGDSDPLTLKPTHATTDALIGGATISFDDSTGNFVSGESITTTVTDGIINDLGVSFTTYGTGISEFPNERVTEVTGAVIALNDPSMLVPWNFPNELTGGPTVDITVPAADLDNAGDYFSVDIGKFVHTNGISLSSGETPLTGWSQRRLRKNSASYGLGFGTAARTYPYLISLSHETRSVGGVASIDTFPTPITRYTSQRMQTAYAASSDVLLAPIFQSNSFNGGVLELDEQAVYNSLITSESPITKGQKIMMAVGLSDSTRFTDGASPSTLNTNVSSFSEIDYGLRFSIDDNMNTLRNLPESITIERGDKSGTDIVDNTSDTYYYSILGLPVLIEVIESGVVKHTITGETVRTIAAGLPSEFSGGANNSGGRFYDHILESGSAGKSLSVGNSAKFTTSGDTFPYLSPNGCNIKRTGTTVTYQLRGQTVYTSLLTSTESLVIAVFREQEIFSTVNGDADRYLVNEQVRTVCDFQVATGNDYWVQVGTSGSGNGIFNSDFLFLQVANRQAFSIKLDGVEADVVELDDAQTLVAGQVSVYPRSGLIRCAAADVGKTVTVNIPCAYLEQ